MKEFIKKVLEYKEKKDLTSEACAEKLGITLEEMLEIEDGKTSLRAKAQEEVLSKVNKSSRRIVKILELIFKFGTTIMALVALLLSIYDNISSNTLIILLSIGLLFSSIQNLPKIDKD